MDLCVRLHSAERVVEPEHTGTSVQDPGGRISSPVGADQNRLTLAIFNPFPQFCFNNTDAHLLLFTYGQTVRRHWSF